VRCACGPGCRSVRARRLAVCVRAARAVGRARRALLLICWPGRLPVTVDSHKPHRSLLSPSPLPNLVIPLLPWQLSPSLSLSQSLDLSLSHSLSLPLSRTFFSLSLSLLPSFLLSFSLYTNTVHAYHFTQYLLNCADVRTTRQIVKRKSLLFFRTRQRQLYIYISIQLVGQFGS